MKIVQYRVIFKVIVICQSHSSAHFKGHSVKVMHYSVISNMIVIYQSPVTSAYFEGHNEKFVQYPVISKVIVFCQSHSSAHFEGRNVKI